MHSDEFVIGDSRWRLLVYPKGDGVGDNKYLSVFLDVGDSGEWRSQDCGFMVNGEVKILAEVGVLEVIEKSDVLKETLLVNESINVNGFQVLLSQIYYWESLSNSMEKQYEKKFTWKIKNFSALSSERINSDEFAVGDSRWRLSVYPKGNGVGVNKYLSVFLKVGDSDSLPSGWRRHAKCRLTVVNQTSENLSQQKEFQHWLDKKSPDWGYNEMLLLTKLLDQNCGFMVNGKVKIVAEVGVLEVIEKSAVLEETLLVNESIDVHGFQVHPSQVESVNSLFKNHPDLASKFRPENSHLRTAYLNSLLTLTEILCHSPKELTIDDLANAYCTLSCLTKAGFKLDWLENKLKVVGETRLQEIEKESKEFKHICANMDALLEFLR